MFVQKMRSDIRPLCDKHLVEMEAVRVKAKMGHRKVDSRKTPRISW